MKSNVILFVLALVPTLHGWEPVNGEAREAARLPKVTLPNGSSPAKANAPRAPMNDSEKMRAGWNHGNGILWVLLKDGAMVLSDRDVTKDGAYRVKFGWWRGVRGKFSIEGRRLDATAPPLRYSAQPESYGDLGFLPSSLYFPTEGYWEIAGHIDNQTLTFVVHVIKKKL
jgi:hypothetical protein